MNAVTPLSLLRGFQERLFSAELTAAAWIDTRRTGRLIPLAWIHWGIRPMVPLYIGTIIAVLGRHNTPTIAAVNAATLMLVEFSRIAAKSHYVLNEENKPCPYCRKQADGDDGPGRGGRGPGRDGVPPAPAPMPDYSDEQIRAMAKNLDRQLINLIATTRRPRQLGDPS